MAKGHAFQAPTGTRDFYPQDMLRRRYIEKMWRDTSIRHGFEEIDGPTFEHLDLYTVKSGEGIVNELFSFKRAGGEKDYALRPEFTPTLARMYAAKAGGLAKPTKWFTTGPFFRAERPQRGRLREFLQWNCDVLGGDEESRSEFDADLLGLVVDGLLLAGLTKDQVRVKLSNRSALTQVMRTLAEVPVARIDEAFTLLDARERIDDDEFERRGRSLVPSDENWPRFLAIAQGYGWGTDAWDSVRHTLIGPVIRSQADYHVLEEIRTLHEEMQARKLHPFIDYSFSIVRGLAYYTGMVFEIRAQGERAVAGGGRYDNLVDLFGGAPTLAVGFGMGDVVFGNLLADRGLIPEGRELLEALGQPGASFRPDVFVVANDAEDSQEAIRPLVAGLRRGVEGPDWLSRSVRKPWNADRYLVRPLHVRHSYKATKNIGKLLQDASACHARFAAILESGSEATLKNLDTGEQVQKVPLGDIAARVNSPR